QDVGHFFCLLDIEAVMDESKFDDRMSSMVQRLKTNKLRTGAGENFIPEDSSARAGAENERYGVFLGPETVVELERWCEHFEIAFDANGIEVEPGKPI